MLHLDIITFRRNLVKADPHFLLKKPLYNTLSSTEIVTLISLLFS